MFSSYAVPIADECDVESDVEEPSDMMHAGATFGEPATVTCVVGTTVTTFVCLLKGFRMRLENFILRLLL